MTIKWTSIAGAVKEICWAFFLSFRQDRKKRLGVRNIKIFIDEVPFIKLTFMLPVKSQIKGCKIL